MGLLDLLVGQLLGNWMSGTDDLKLMTAVRAELKRLHATGAPSDELVGQAAAFIEAQLAPHVDTSKLVATIRGVAADLVHGTAGVDPDAWGGSV